MDFEFTPVESLDKVPEQFRSIYSDKADETGKFGVNPAFKGVAEAITGFNKTTKQLRADLKKAAPVDLSPLAEFGDNPATIAEAVKAKITEAAGAKGADVQKQIEGVKSALAQAHAKEIEKREQRATALQSQLYTLMVENAATAAVAELKGVPELLLPFIKNQVKVVEQDGNFIVHVVDGSGEVRYGATGQPMTIKELVAEMKANAKYGRLFESDTAGGGGKQPGSGRTPPRQQGKELSANDRIAAGIAARQRR